MHGRRRRSVKGYEARIAERPALVDAQAEANRAQRELIERLQARVAELERQLGQNSGKSGRPPSRHPAAERQREAEQRRPSRPVVAAVGRTDRNTGCLDRSRGKAFDLYRR